MGPITFESVGGTFRMGRVKVGTLIIDILTSVLRPIILQYQLTVLKFMRIRVLKQTDLTLASSWEKVCAKIKSKEKELHYQARLQLGLETIFQLAGNVVLLCYLWLFTYQNHSRTHCFVQARWYDYLEPYFIIRIYPWHVACIEFDNVCQSELYLHCRRLWIQLQNHWENVIIDVHSNW